MLPNSILRLLEKSNLKTALLSASAMRVTVVDLSYVWRWEKIRRNWRKNKKGFWCFFSIWTIFNNLAERLYIFCFVKSIIWFLGGHWLFSLKNNLICFKILFRIMKSERKKLIFLNFCTGWTITLNNLYLSLRLTSCTHFYVNLCRSKSFCW